MIDHSILPAHPGGIRTLEQLLAVQSAGCSRCGATVTNTMIEDAIKRFMNE